MNSLIAMIANPWLGSMADRVGRKKVIIPIFWMTVLSIFLFVIYPSYLTFFFNQLCIAPFDTLRECLFAIIRDVMSKDEYLRKNGGWTAFYSRYVIPSLGYTTIS